MTEISRRTLISAGLVTGGLALWAGATQFYKPKVGATHFFLSANDDQQGNHFIGAWSLTGQHRFQLPVAHRAHDSCCSPDKTLAVFFARRPGTQMYIVDLKNGRLRYTMNAQKGYHYYGHGVFSKNGRYLFTTENHFQASSAEKSGIIAVYDTHTAADQGFKRVNEYASGGIGPHQLAWLNNDSTLVVANGGILTHPDRGREKLNLSTMNSSLSYIDSQSGTILKQLQPEHPQMSIRHLAVASNDQVIMGVQYQGEKHDPITLVLSHHGEQHLTPMLATDAHWRRQNQYIASIAVDKQARFAVSTSPRGASVSIWDLSSLHCVGQLSVRDVAGVTYLADSNRFLVSNGLGQLLSLQIDQGTPTLQPIYLNPSIRWDNHLSLIS
jgi:uncharacterized protein